MSNVSSQDTGFAPLLLHIRIGDRSRALGQAEGHGTLTSAVKASGLAHELMNPVNGASLQHLPQLLSVLLAPCSPSAMSPDEQNFCSSGVIADGEQKLRDMKRLAECLGRPIAGSVPIPGKFPTLP